MHPLGACAEQGGDAGLSYLLASLEGQRIGTAFQKPRVRWELLTNSWWSGFVPRRADCLRPAVTVNVPLTGKHDGPLGLVPGLAPRGFFCEPNTMLWGLLTARFLLFTECSDFSPPVTVILLIFLCLESLLFFTFTAVMFGTQIHSICNDETVRFLLRHACLTLFGLSKWAIPGSTAGAGVLTQELDRTGSLCLSFLSLCAVQTQGSV